MTSIKLSYENETRRVLLRENGESLNYPKLMNTLLNLFPALCGKVFQLTWEDDEGDLIVCSSDAELEDALFVMNSQSRTLKFGVKLLSGDHGDSSANKAKDATGSASVRTVHTNVTCDECGVCPIVGYRYKCAIRQDFDLCERCEAKKVQPYPMIKISDPAQAPEILIFGLRDGQRNEEGLGGFGGRHWPRGFRHPHHHHPHHGPPPGCPPPPPPGPGPAPYAANDNNSNNFGPWGRRRCGWGRKWEKFAADFAKDPIPAPVAQAVAPIISAIDSVVNQFTGGDDDAAPSSNPNTAAAAAAPPVNSANPAPRANEGEISLEDQLIEQAIRESLTINSEAKLEEKAGTTATSVPPTYVETSKPAVPTLPKPALRFVRDVTFPDGTTVQPGAAFRKAWRVRNDGNHAWPEGASLVSVGGDVLSDPNHKESLPVIHPEQEAEIALQLVAPDLPGMYTAYFRAQTKEQQYFGQRLWAAIVVADHESNDWQVITEQKSTPALSPVASASNTAVSTGSNDVLQGSTQLPVVDRVNEVVPQAAAPVPQQVDPVPAPVSVPVEVTPSAAPVPAPVSEAPTHLRPVILLWRRELAILSDMGFDDVEANIPLLQQHFASPLSLSADKNAVPNVEAMQRVVAALLTLQMS